MTATINESAETTSAGGVGRIARVIGPVLASALIGDEKAYTLAYTTIGVIALASVALTFVTKVPAGRDGARD